MIHAHPRPASSTYTSALPMCGSSPHVPKLVHGGHIGRRVYESSSASGGGEVTQCGAKSSEIMFPDTPESIAIVIMRRPSVVIVMSWCSSPSPPTHPPIHPPTDPRNPDWTATDSTRGAGFVPHLLLRMILLLLMRCFPGVPPEARTAVARHKPLSSTPSLSRRIMRPTQRVALHRPPVPPVDIHTTSKHTPRHDTTSEPIPEPVLTRPFV